MTLTKNYAHIYGFEDYNIVSIRNNIFKQSWNYTLPYKFDNSAGSYIITKDLPVRVYKDGKDWWADVAFEPALCENHNELLDTAKKLYVHPSCKLSRNMMAEKYKKSLNPYLSDAVVIPTPDYDELQLNPEVLFVNEKAKIIVKIGWDIDDADTVNAVNNLHEGDVLENHIACAFEYGWRTPYKMEDVLYSEFMYAGPVLFIPNSQGYVIDILTNNIPADRIVFEESVQDSLSSESNQLTFDSLTSIKDMLDSSDDNTVSAGLKALSMMDWMHYPNSVKYMLKQVGDRWNWIYNKAANSTSVKFMMNSLSSGRKRNHWPGEYDEDIYSKDYELFKQLKMHYERTPLERIIEAIRMYDFMCVDSQGLCVPRLK